MKQLKSNARMWACVVIVATFFLPSYEGLSGYQFIDLALNAPSANTQLTFTDSMIALLPLLLVPGTAIMLFLRSVQRIPVRRSYAAFPLLFLLFFTGILFWAERTDPGVRSLMDLPARMGPGYYLAYAACLLLPFTRNRKRRRHRRSPQADSALPGLAV